MSDDNRHQLMAVDLDGTLVNGNTLKMYIRCGLERLVRRCRYGRVLRIAGWMALRRLRVVSHARMKFAILPLIDSTDPLLRAQFTMAVSNTLNRSVVRLIDDWRRDGAPVLLATAAADTYVPWIWMGPYVATAMTDNPDHVEMRGERKAQAVTDYAAAHGCEVAIALTDHMDDLPLMRICTKGVMLVGATDRLVRRVEAAGIHVLAAM